MVNGEPAGGGWKENYGYVFSLPQKSSLLATHTMKTTGRRENTSPGLSPHGEKTASKLKAGNGQQAAINQIHNKEFWLVGSLIGVKISIGRVTSKTTILGGIILRSLRIIELITAYIYYGPAQSFNSTPRDG